MVTLIHHQETAINVPYCPVCSLSPFIQSRILSPRIVLPRDKTGLHTSTNITDSVPHRKTQRSMSRWFLFCSIHDFLIAWHMDKQGGASTAGQKNTGDRRLCVHTNFSTFSLTHLGISIACSELDCGNNEGSCWGCQVVCRAMWGDAYKSLTSQMLAHKQNQIF